MLIVEVFKIKNDSNRISIVVIKILNNKLLVVAWLIVI